MNSVQRFFLREARIGRVFPLLLVGVGAETSEGALRNWSPSPHSSPVEGEDSVISQRLKGTLTFPSCFES